MHSIDNASYHLDSLMWHIVFFDYRVLLPALLAMYDVAAKLYFNYDVTIMAPIFTNWFATRLITSITSQVTSEANTMHNLLCTSFQELLPITTFIFSSVSSIALHWKCECYIFSVSHLVCVELMISSLTQSAYSHMTCCLCRTPRSFCTELDLIKHLHYLATFLHWIMHKPLSLS